MFTGIIEALGEVTHIKTDGTNKIFWIKSKISEQLKVDESMSHNGVCLTIEEIINRTHKITAVKETLDKTDLTDWKLGDVINLERSIKMNGRLDGHIVQGHIDTTAVCINKKILKGSQEFTFKIKKRFSSLVIEKGSICLNGISLTAFNVRNNKFTVAIIPYTIDNTNLSFIKEGSKVNIEFDILGKYVQRMLEK